MKKSIINHSWLTIREANLKNKGRVNTQPSLTVQGLSESMSTILERYQRGQTLSGSSSSYFDSQVNPNYENEQPFKASEFDLSDLDKAISLTKQAMQDIAEAKKLAEDKATQELIDKAVAAKLAELNQGAPGDVPPVVEIETK